MCSGCQSRLTTDPVGQASFGLSFTFLKEMATHSSPFAWKIPCTEEPGRLQSMGS